jgi:hypothetical protein
MKYHADAEDYIKKLMRIQHVLIMKYPGYQHNAVVNAMTRIRLGFDSYKTRTDAGMKRFWVRFREAIEYLIPGEKYPGHDKLRREFEELDQFEIWQSLSNSLKP